MSSNVSTRLLDRRRRSVADRYQRRRTVVLGAIAACATGAGVWWIATGPVLQVRHVAISGYREADQAAVVQSVQVAAATGDALHLPVQRIRTALRDAPWVEDVRVRHDWPNGVTVAITPATPAVIAITSGGDRWIVSSHGRVLAQEEETAQRDLPQMTIDAVSRGQWLKGPQQLAPVRLAAALSKDVRGIVRNLHVQDGVLIGQLATTGTELRFGQLTDLWRKGRSLDALLAAPSTQPTLTKTDYIDLSNAERPVFGGLPAGESQASTASQASESGEQQPSTSG